MTAARPTHPLRNALRLDPGASAFVELAVFARDLGEREMMRKYAEAAMRRARLVWRTFVEFPAAA